MSKNNSLTTLSKSATGSAPNLRQGPTYLAEPKDSTSINDITAELAEENQRRLNDVGGGIGRFFRWIFSGSKKDTTRAPEAPKKTFYQKLDEAIEKKPKKSEFYIQKKDSYLTIPSPKIYDPRINAAEKSTVELLNSSNLTSNPLLESEQDRYTSFLEKGLEQLYFALKIREIPRVKADSLGMSDDQHESFYSKLNEAKPNLEQAAKLNESSAVPIFYEGIFHLVGKEKLTPAQEFFKEALKINPEMPWANHFLGLTLNSPNKSRQHFETEIQKNRNPQSLQQLAQIDFEEKKYDHALTKFEEVLALDPTARLAHLRISEIYRHKGEPEKELEHLNKELKSAHRHHDQKLANRISRDLGYYNLRQGNPHEALRLFNDARVNRMSHEIFSVTHLFDKANAVAMIDGAEKAEEDLLEITRNQFIKSVTQPRVANLAKAPIYLEPFKLLSEFRIKHYGFQESRERLEEQLKEAEKISDPKPQESQLRLSIKIELATLLYTHSKTLKKNKPEKLELLEESKQILNEESKNNPSYQEIKQTLETLLNKSITTKKTKENPEKTPETNPGNSPQKSSHHKVEDPQNKSHNRTPG